MLKKLSLVLALALFSPSAYAAPSYLVREYATGKQATTSPTYMTAGTATTTLSFSTDGVDLVAFNIAFSSSGTAPILDFRYEYSNDNINWFPESEELQINATSTQLTSFEKSYRWIYASTSAINKYTTSTGLATTTTLFKQVKVRDIASNFMRAIFYIPTGSAPANVWVEATKKVSAF